MRAVLLLLAILVAAPAAAGTPAPARHTIVLRPAPARPAIVFVDDGKPVMHVKLVKLARTPPPRCVKDRRGAIRCAITY
jgi:hypothetical protein